MTARDKPTENGVAWLPYWLERMDTFYQMQVERGYAGEETPWLRRAPSEYLRRGQIYCHCESEERTLPESLAYLGDDVCFYASDFPHEEVTGSELKRLQARSDISQRARDGILGDNALRLYGPRLATAAGARGAASATA